MGATYTLLLLNIQENAVTGGKASKSQKTLTAVPKLAPTATTPLLLTLLLLNIQENAVAGGKHPLHSGP
jgi:hypothetical protein